MKPWTIGKVIFGPEGKPVPLLTSQGGKPYNFEFIKALEEEVKTLTERLREAERERDNLRFELDGLDVVRKKDNAYLIHRAEQAERELAEWKAGAHAIRCTCDGATRDARCVELQGLAEGPPAEPDPPADPLGGFRPNLAR